MVIERLKKDEIPELLELYKGLGQCEMSLSASEKTFEKISSNNDYLLLVAKENDEIVGSVLGIICYSLPLLGRPFLVIEDVIVKETYRRKGIAQMLFDKIETYAKEQQCVYSILVSSGFRKEAHLFYEKIGYTEDVKGFRKLFTKF